MRYTGMIWTGFRPSDDACKYNYLIPAEMMAVVALGELEEIERDGYHNLIKAQRERRLAPTRYRAGFKRTAKSSRRTTATSTRMRWMGSGTRF